MNSFVDLYKRVNQIRVDTCPPAALSGLLHGYLSVCSIVRVYPWLEEVYGTWWDNHLRIREIARELDKLVCDETLPCDERAGYVVDLLDAYQTYDDMPFVDLGLEIAYTLLSTEEVKEMIAAGGTANVCRLLCCCFYFAGDEECKEVAGNMVRGWMEEGRKNGMCSRKKWQAIRFYESVVGEMEVSVEERVYLIGEQTRLGISVEQEEVEYFKQAGNSDDIHLLAEVFEILARREFLDSNEFFIKRE